MHLHSMMQVVLDNMNKDTFGAFLDVASSHHLERLEAKCIDYLLTNFNKVSRQCTLCSCLIANFHL